MDENFVTLDDQLLGSLNATLTKIESALQDIMVAADRFPGLRSNLSGQRKLIAIKRVGAIAHGLLALIPEFAKQLHVVILPMTLAQITFDIRNQVTVIESYLALF